MKVKQYNIRVFELKIEDKSEVLEFIKRNYQILNKYLVLLNGDVNQEIENALNNYSIQYTLDRSLQSLSYRKNGVNEIFLKPCGCKESEGDRSNKSSSLNIINRIIRSGQELIENGDLLLRKRVNSGSIVRCGGNLISPNSLIEGIVECNGNFMMIRASKKANIMFCGMDLTNYINDESLYEVEAVDGKIIITKVDTKEVREISINKN